MLRHMIDEVKTTSATALRLSALAAACAVSIFIAVGFICAAAFVIVDQQYGLPEACLAGAGVFLVLSLVLAIAYTACRQSARQAAQQAEKSAFAAAITDPATLAIALQVGRAIGFKRMVPLLAIAAVAFGIASARHGDAREDED
jgi:hypothetical protein